MKSIIAELPVGIEITQVADQPHIVDESVSEFLKTFVEALGIVLLVSFLTLGLRTGIVVALSVPLVLAIVFIVMYAAGLDLHRITLGALIIALGLLVDDAIIAIEMMVVKMEQGFSRAQAATFAWTSTAFPMLTGTLVTAAGFLPVGFANSSTGEYAGGIFWVVGLALIASWFVAVLFTPYLGLKLLPDRGKRAGARPVGVGAYPHPLIPAPAGIQGLRALRARFLGTGSPLSRRRAGDGLPVVRDLEHDHESIYDTRVYRALRGVIELCLRWRKTVVAATVLMFVAAIAAFGLVQQQFFPTSSRTELFFEMRLPEGSAIGVTDAAAKKAESLLTDDPDIVTYTSYVGQGAPRFWLGLNPVLPNTNFAQIVIVTKDLAARERVKSRLERALADGALPEARTRVDRFTFGPPVGFPVQFRVIGPDPLKVRDIAEQVRQTMAANPKLIDPHLEWGEQSKSIRLEVDQDRARALGLTPQDVAQTLQTLLSGFTVTQYREGIESIDVVARAVPTERLDLSRLPDLTIATRNGVAVPLSQIARIKYQYEEPILWRRNRDLVLTVLGDIVDGVQAPDVSNEVLPKLQSIKDALPVRLSDRDRRRDRGEREGECLARRGVPGDGGRDAGGPDDPAAELLAAWARVRDRAARDHRGDRRAADLEPSVRFRGAARHDRARRHDHAQHRDPGRPDRPRHRRRTRAASRHRRCDGAPGAPGRADRAGRDPRHDSARPQPVLGADGDHHHGWSVRCDDPDAGGGAGALRRVVPRAGERGRRCVHPRRCGDRDGADAHRRGMTAQNSKRLFKPSP